MFGGTAATIPATITVTADSVALSNQAVKPGNAPATFVGTSLGPAPAGNIALNVNTLRVNVNPDGTPIEGARKVFINSPGSSTDSTGGPAGTLTISGLGPEATDAAKLVALNNVNITTAVEGGTAALPPGAITITADTMTLTGETGIVAFTSSAAPAGNIALNVNTLRANVKPDGTLINGQPQSFIASTSDSSTSTAGRAGTVTISGLGPEATDAAKLVVLNNTELSTTVKGGTAATRPATITMTADMLSLTNSRNIKADTSGAAPAGNITFNVNTLTADQATISSRSTSVAATAGNAGSVRIQGQGGDGTLADTITVRQSTITTEADTGPGGSITLGARNQIAMTDSTISATVTGGRLPGGNITFAAGEDVLLSNGSIISAESTGLGDAGTITITAGHRILDANSAVTTQASQADGGNVSLTAGSMAHLIKSQITTSVGSGQGKGGNITIDPRFVVLDNSQIRADAFGGPGGNVKIVADVYLTTDSVVSASSALGVPGTINILASTTNVSATLARLPEAVAQAATLLRASCAARVAAGKASSLVVAGREGVPLEPGGYLPSPLMVEELGSAGLSRSEGHYWETFPRLSSVVLAPACSR